MPRETFTRFLICRETCIGALRLEKNCAWEAAIRKIWGFCASASVWTWRDAVIKNSADVLRKLGFLWLVSLSRMISKTLCILWELGFFIVYFGNFSILCLSVYWCESQYFYCGLVCYSPSSNVLMNRCTLSLLLLAPTGALIVIVCY